MLSGGERQRLGIARAIYKNAPIIILDEATSSLDSETEGKIMEKLLGEYGKDKTFLIISHRLGTLKYTDNIAVMERGKVVEEGSYDKLMNNQSSVFYRMNNEKIKVPPPTFCPECRLVRRMLWRNERSLFKRSCAKTSKQIITMFHPDAKVVVYDHDTWWSDQWEPTDYGKDYDFSKPFFEQFKELLYRTSLANLGNSNNVGSPYGNHNADCKYCYLLYASFNVERTHYSYGAVRLKDCMDMYVCLHSELCYNDIVSTDLYKTIRNANRHTYP